MHEELMAMWAGFADPPDESRPRAWWHWMDGNVDPEGIRLDLEWLHGAGVRGVQMFDGGMGTPLVVPERVEFGTAEWREGHPTGEIFAPVADVYEPHAEIRPSGLSGPVVLRSYAPPAEDPVG